MPFPKRYAHFRFYGALNDFLPVSHRQSEVQYTFRGRPSIKDAIEAQGVPHPEVDLLLANGAPVSFDASLAADDRVSVYPWLQRLDRPDEALRPPWPSPLRFLCDVHLGRLARHLRMLGFDTRCDSDRTDEELARISDEDRRFLLTRDIGLLKRSRVQLGTFIRSEAPEHQLAEAAGRFGLGERGPDLFSRCLDCNVPLEPAGAEAVTEKVPPHAQRVNDDFRQCPSCEAVFWEGTHVERMRRLAQRTLGETVA